MCIYCGTTKYRRIYEQHNGPIPKEENDRSYEIHHIDGDHSNNDPINLKCVTIQEHYDIHYSQGDYGACFLLGKKQKVSPEKLSDLNRLQNLTRIQNNTHNLIKRADGSSHASDRVKNGTHHFLDKEAASLRGKKRVENGTHHFLKQNRSLAFVDKVNQPVYKWKHVKTGEIEILTAKDFMIKHDLSKYQGNISWLISGKHKSVKGWIVIRD